MPISYMLVPKKKSIKRPDFNLQEKKAVSMTHLTINLAVTIHSCPLRLQATMLGMLARPAKSKGRGESTVAAIYCRSAQ